MRISSSETEKIIVQLLNLGCTSNEGETFYEIYFRDERAETVALITLIKDGTNDSVIEQFNSKIIQWNLVPVKK